MNQPKNPKTESVCPCGHKNIVGKHAVCRKCGAPVVAFTPVKETVGDHDDEHPLFV